MLKSKLITRQQHMNEQKLAAQHKSYLDQTGCMEV